MQGTAVDLAVKEAGHTLSGIELLGDLSAAEIEALEMRCRWRRYAAQQQIISQQDEATDVYFIAGGQVRVTVYSQSGKEVAFRDLGAGKTFGEIAAIDGAPRSASVFALTETVLASLTADAFAKVLREHPDMAARVLKQLAGYVRQLSERVFEFSVLAVRNRIHAELLRLARDQGGAGNTVTIGPAPTHADIASRVSTHREAVTRELNALARSGLIERRSGALVIADVARLARLVEEVPDD